MPRTTLLVSAAAALALVVAARESTAATGYAEQCAALATQRARLAERYRAASQAEQGALLLEARQVVLEALLQQLIPAWLGTPWNFYGTSERPRHGNIACGYFVTTLLRDAGLRIERAKLAQQASERIIQTLVPAAEIERFSNRSSAAVVERVRQRGDGLYLVGLDYHVGFLAVEGQAVQFCHASYLPPAAVVCEAAAGAAAFGSNYRVVGKLFGDAMLRRWLGERHFSVGGDSG